MKQQKALEATIYEAAQNMVSTIMSSLRGLTLEQITGGGYALVRKAAKKAKAEVEPKVRKPVSRKVARARKLQGAYMGFLRQFKGKVRDQMVKLAKTDKAKAVAAMRKLRTAQAGKR